MENISVIIPTYNEEEETLIKSIRSLSHMSIKEIIIVAGGEAEPSYTLISSDKRIRFLQSNNRSRALQMNEGAKIASNGLLLFMHADTCLGADCIDEAAGLLQRGGVSLVSFDLRFESDKKSMRVIEFGARLRNMLFKLPYGDQCYLVRKDDFLAVGGFDDVPILEDVKFVGKMKKRGKVIITKAGVTTSPRRYDERGVFKTYLRNLKIIVMYYSGRSLESIKKHY